MRLIFCGMMVGCFFLLAAVLPVRAEELSGRTIHICGDVAEWPPYIFFERVEGQKTGKIAGYSVDVIREILEGQSATVEIRMLPWKRCLYEVEKGDAFQIVLDATLSAERAAKFHISRPYYTTTPCYFYSKKHHPKGLGIRSAADLKAYRINGIAGYNYADYGLAPDEIKAYLDGHQALIQKLHRNRCDLFPDWLEVVMGFAATGRDLLADKDLGYAPVPGLAPSQFHMMFPKNVLGLELKRIVDEGLREMAESGRLKELLKQYAP